MLRHHFGGLCAAVMSNHSIPFRLVGSGIGAERPRIVVFPIVHRIGPLSALKESDLYQAFDKGAFLSWPVDAQLDILTRQRRKVSVRPVRGNPCHQAHQPPGRVCPKAAYQLLGLRVRRHPDVDPHVDGHGLHSAIAAHS
jgi:hypothetical protein